VTALRLSEDQAAANIVSEIMEDPGDNFMAHEMCVKFALICGAICTDQGCQHRAIRQVRSGGTAQDGSQVTSPPCTASARRLTASW
jgi:hypothetical protein